MNSAIPKSEDGGCGSRVAVGAMAGRADRSGGVCSGEAFSGTKMKHEKRYL